MSVIKLRPKKDTYFAEEPMYMVYERAISRFLAKHTEPEDFNRDDIKKLIYLEVKYIGAIERAKNRDTKLNFYKSTPMERFKFLDAIVSLIGLLKPIELMQLFPIEKYYDGAAIQTKDYYYTMDVINKLDPDKPIGNEVLSLLWDYQNWDITTFLVEFLQTINIVGMYHGKPDALDVLFNNLQDDKTDEKPNKLPSYLKVLK